jgi:hypothetical protein
MDKILMNHISNDRIDEWIEEIKPIISRIDKMKININLDEFKQDIMNDYLKLNIMNSYVIDIYKKLDNLNNKILEIENKLHNFTISNDTKNKISKIIRSDDYKPECACLQNIKIKDKISRTIERNNLIPCNKKICRNDDYIYNDN